jgi:zinc protease
VRNLHDFRLNHTSLQSKITSERKRSVEKILADNSSAFCAVFYLQLGLFRSLEAFCFSWLRSVLVFYVLFFCFFQAMAQQETPPTPAPPKPIRIPSVKEKKLSNGLTIAVIEKKNVPLVAVYFLIGDGASKEDLKKAGLANLTASLLTKGTKTRSATKIAEDIEFLGGTLVSGADWNRSYIGLSITSDKLASAMSIMADVLLNPTFAQKEIGVLKTQIQDNLSYNLRQPGFLASYVASVYSYGEHPVLGTPESLKNIGREDIVSFYKRAFAPEKAVLIFVGDVSLKRAESLARRFFGNWRNKVSEETETKPQLNRRENSHEILIIDLPDSGQAAVTYTKEISGIRRDDTRRYFEASVSNSILGGGYSARLNQEIRIKRGLSYGARSNFSWRRTKANFVASAQTKNESAAEVAELILREIKKLSEQEVSSEEIKPRKAALIGSFSRSTETNFQLAIALAELYTFGVPTKEINSYVQEVEAVNSSQIKDFASNFLVQGEIIIVGDYEKMKDDLSKRFASAKIKIVRANELNLEKLVVD